MKLYENLIAQVGFEPTTSSLLRDCKPLLYLAELLAIPHDDYS